VAPRTRFSGFLPALVITVLDKPKVVGSQFNLLATSVYAQLCRAAKLLILHLTPTCGNHDVDIMEGGGRGCRLAAVRQQETSRKFGPSGFCHRSVIDMQTTSHLLIAQFG
jgi:hypothetical protein